MLKLRLTEKHNADLLITGFVNTKKATAEDIYIPSDTEKKRAVFI